MDGLGWVYDPDVLTDARDQALPFRGDTTAHEKAWAARVDAAVAGMDVMDPAGLDAWMASHAKAPEPHLAEAALVAVWETRIRDLFADVPGLDDTQDDAAADLVSVEDDSDGLP